MIFRWNFSNPSLGEHKQAKLWSCGLDLFVCLFVCLFVLSLIDIADSKKHHFFELHESGKTAVIFQPPFRGTHVTLAWSKLGEMYPVKPCLLKKLMWLDDVFFLTDKDGSQGFSKFVCQIAKQKNEANMLGIGYVFHFPYQNTQIRYLG